MYDAVGALLADPDLDIDAADMDCTTCSEVFEEGQFVMHPELKVLVCKQCAANLKTSSKRPKCGIA